MVFLFINSLELESQLCTAKSKGHSRRKEAAIKPLSPETTFDKKREFILKMYNVASDPSPCVSGGGHSIHRLIIQETS